MRDAIFGIGSHSTLFDVISSGAEQIERTCGASRKIVVTGGEIEVVAARPELEGDFESLCVRFPAADDRLEALQTLADEVAAECTVEEIDGRIEVRAEATDDPESLPVVITRLSALLELPEVWHAAGEDFRSDVISAYTLFKAMQQHQASDVHLVPGAPPSFRVDGDIRRADNLPAMSATQVMDFIAALIPEDKQNEFETRRQTSFKYHQIGLAFSRVSAFYRSGVPHCTLRFLPEVIPSFEDLHVPVDIMQNLAALHDGLVLVTGMTGSGKSTTVAALIDWINRTRASHVLCVEDPIEYVHNNQKSMVSQREIGEDIATFGEAVHGALRQDPDVIFVGEMRDTDTIRAVINAAATGHLVISTLHSNSASDVTNRITSFFDPSERDLVRMQLHDCLRCVLCQRLLPRRDRGRIPALEFLFNDIKHISQSILGGDSEGIRLGMQQTLSASSTFEESLLRLVKDGHVESDLALEYAPHPETFEQMQLGTYVAPSLESLVHH